MQKEQQPYYADDDIKIVDIVTVVTAYFYYILRKFWVILIGIALFILAGFLFAKLSPAKYQAHSSFNVVSSKGGGGFGGLMSLASSFGVSMGAGSNEVLYGVYTSRNVVSSAFLSTVNYKGEQKRLGEIFMDNEDITESLIDDPIFKDFKFVADDIDSVSRLETDMLARLFNGFIENYFEIEYDIIAGVIRSVVTTKDYDFSKQMASKMLTYSSDFYISKQIESKQKSLALINSKMDSVKQLLKTKETQLASLQDQNLYMKKSVGNLNQSRLLREIATLSAIFSNTSLTQDAAQSSLMTETPVINIVDNPQHSMVISKRKAKFWIIIGGLVGLGLSLIYLILGKAIEDAFEKEEQKKRELEGIA